ncbi:hypothetical protein HMPREF1979_00821, partial [Actinomyces johnsonii F0542]
GLEQPVVHADVSLLGVGDAVLMGLLLPHRRVRRLNFWRVSRGTALSW